MKVLITGGAGYIGSTVAHSFVDKKHEVTIIDNLINGSISNIPKKCNFIKCDIGDVKSLRKLVLTKHDIVLHFAALIDNQESLAKRDLYLDNNYTKSKIFFNFCIERGMKNFIFSSTAAVYGKSNVAVDERSKTKPLSPYGQSKLKFENFLKKSEKNINYVILRYFNVAGVETKMRCGFKIQNNKSLFSNLCRSYHGTTKFNIYGKNFNTNDGTAVRDFIYISDLSEIHYKFSLAIVKKKLRLVVNCGYGHGYSVMDIIKKLKDISKKNFYYVFKKRRKNDIEYSVANTDQLNKLYDIQFNNDKLKIILKTSLLWHEKFSKNIEKTNRKIILQKN
tara:strand:+ start:36277 stop:37281 length:1005 start_codon:yes stop_codon:yes gene_type:complete